MWGADPVPEDVHPFLFIALTVPGVVLAVAGPLLVVP
jgi:hypothetical protein